MTTKVSEKSIIDIVRDSIIKHIVNELPLSSMINNHNSLYFFALPFAFSTGYFSAFF